MILAASVTGTRQRVHSTGKAKLTGFDPATLSAWLTHPGSSRESNGLGSVEAVARGIHRAPAVGGRARAAVSLSHGLARTRRGGLAGGLSHFNSSRRSASTVLVGPLPFRVNCRFF